MQLVAYGAQDVYLTGNPQITFFKVVYRRHTNFSMECIEQTWSGNSIVDGRCVATISRNGDLVHKMYLQLECTNANNPPSISDLIVDAEVEIGGQSIDKQSGAFMQAWNELTHTCGIDVGGGGDNGTLFQKMSGTVNVGTNSRFVPLNFWFCKNAGLALPLIALQYHEVKVILNHTLTAAYGGGVVSDNTLWVDYIYLDTDERRRFAQVSHEYLIEQVQEQTLQGGKSGDHKLSFNHPVKELIWFATATELDVNWPRVTLPVVQHRNLPDATYTLKLNGHDRFSARPHTYFSRVQVYQHHSGDGGDNSLFNFSTALVERGNVGQAPDASEKLGLISDSICVYSFALNPEEHQPSGTCNFSRIDTAELNSSQVIAADTDENLEDMGANDASDIVLTSRIVAINYNVLRIMSGMGGLAYSN